MAEKEKAPSYMAQLLDELGWNQGTRIPLADAQNQELENLLINRQNEIQRLKEALILQKQKSDDLNKYKHNVHTEYQENARLLFAHKQQMEQEVKLKQLSTNEADRLDRDIIDAAKQSKDITARIDRLQTMTRCVSANQHGFVRGQSTVTALQELHRWMAASNSNIARLLKKADSLKSEVCGERGALQEWRAALERSAGDISAIEKFTKQDVSKAKNLETKRQKLKVEHDHMQDRLNQLVSNLSAEERACERISVQVMEGMEQRKQMMDMWTGAVENLRQRDTDIRHIREDYAVLEAESNKIAEQCREQQAFCDQQQNNNAEIDRQNMGLAQQLSQIRMAYQGLCDENMSNESEAHSLQRELSNIRVLLEKRHIENRQIMEDQHRKDVALEALQYKLKELKEKIKDSLDKSKSSEKRAKELEDMLNEEERYASQLTLNQQRAMHCSFVEQQKLLALKNEEKLFHMQLKASRAIMSKLDNKERCLQKNLQSQKESLYAISYQVETLGAQVSHMEGAQAERECSAELVERENRLKEVASREAARLALLERRAARLHDDMRRLARELDAETTHSTKLQSRLKTSMLNVSGGEKELRASRECWRASRVEEALVRLRVAHAARALAGLGDAAYTLDKQRLQLDAAMNERLVEISARRDMFSVQKRAIFEDCGKLRAEIKEREGRIDQLKKRYDIFIGSLGKDESGQQLSVTFFKIKFAAERAELRGRGAALDAEVVRRERDVAALEATLRVVHAAHTHFMHHIAPLADDTPEIEELNSITNQYYAKRDILKGSLAEIAQLEQLVSDTAARLTSLTDKCKLLSAREAETENELEGARERMNKQEIRLQNARDIVKYNAKRAQKLVEGVDDWRIFQMCIWLRDYHEAACSALAALGDTCAGAASSQLAALVAATDLSKYVARHQRRLMMIVNKILSDPNARARETGVSMDVTESVFSSSSESNKSGVSVGSGFTRRLTTFRKSLAPKLQEPSFIDDLPEIGRRSTVAMRVVTLGMESTTTMMSTMERTTRKSSR